MRRACSSCVVLRKSGVWQTSQSRIRFDRSRVRRMTISSVESWRSVVSSWLSSESLRPARGGGAASDRIGPAATGNRAGGCAIPRPLRMERHAPSTAATMSGSRSGAFARHAERAVPAKAAGAPGDLGYLLRMEAAQAPAVELA